MHAAQANLTGWQMAARSAVRRRNNLACVADLPGVRNTNSPGVWFLDVPRTEETQVAVTNPACPKTGAIAGAVPRGGMHHTNKRRYIIS